MKSPPVESCRGHSFLKGKETPRFPLWDRGRSVCGHPFRGVPNFSPASLNDSHQIRSTAVCGYLVYPACGYGMLSLTIHTHGTLPTSFLGW